VSPHRCETEICQQKTPGGGAEGSPEQPGKGGLALKEVLRSKAPDWIVSLLLQTRTLPQRMLTIPNRPRARAALATALHL